VIGSIDRGPVGDLEGRGTFAWVGNRLSLKLDQFLIHPKLGAPLGQLSLVLKRTEP
jgi:hypothetical protein